MIPANRSRLVLPVLSLVLLGLGFVIWRPLRAGEARAAPLVEPRALIPPADPPRVETLLVAVPMAGGSTDSLRPAVRTTSVDRDEALPSDFSSVSACAANRALNPRGAKLTPADRARLSDLLAAQQETLKATKNAIVDAANDRVSERIRLGLATLDVGNQQVDRFGDGEVRLFVDTGQASYIVDLHRGEDAVLDDLFAQRDFVLADGFEQITKFFAELK